MYLFRKQFLIHSVMFYHVATQNPPQQDAEGRFHTTNVDIPTCSSVSRNDRTAWNAQHTRPAAPGKSQKNTNYQSPSPPAYLNSSGPACTVAPPCFYCQVSRHQRERHTHTLIYYIHTHASACVALLPVVTHSSDVKDARLHRVSRSVYLANATS